MNLPLLALIWIGSMNLEQSVELLNTNPEPNLMIVNDTVMGGRSGSQVEPLKPAGVVFRGTVSLENNGGFASFRMTSGGISLEQYDGIEVRVRGDGRVYQLRIRTDDGFDGIAYRAEFKTEPSTWMTVRIPFPRFVPSFRGRLVENARPLHPGRVRQIGILIADGRAGSFRLEIESISAFRTSS